MINPFVLINIIGLIIILIVGILVHDGETGAIVA